MCLGGGGGVKDGQVSWFSWQARLSGRRGLGVSQVQLIMRLLLLVWLLLLLLLLGGYFSPLLTLSPTPHFPLSRVWPLLTMYES